MDLDEFIRAMPKVELHVHLEGSIRPATLLELARRNNVQLPASTLEQLREWYRFTDFAHFIRTYGTIIHCLQTPDDFALIAAELGATMAEQNIRYAEVTWSPVTHVARTGFPFAELLAGANQGRAAARDKYGVEMRWVVDVVRNLHARGVDGTETAAMAMAGQDAGVVALGLGGMETGFGPELFRAAFDAARSSGLRSVPHAGEAAGPESVWGALRDLGADRIGHGIRAIEDPALVAYLREHQIPLEVCPTSNVCTGVVSDMAAHPIRRLYDAGVYITVNSDDPPMFNTTLTDEYRAIATTFGFDAAALETLVVNAARASLLPDDARAQLCAAIEGEFRVLRAGQALQ